MTQLIGKICTRTALNPLLLILDHAVAGLLSLKA